MRYGPPKNPTDAMGVFNEGDSSKHLDDMDVLGNRIERRAALVAAHHIPRLLARDRVGNGRHSVSQQATVLPLRIGIARIASIVPLRGRPTNRAGLLRRKDGVSEPSARVLDKELVKRLSCLKIKHNDRI